MAAIPSEQDVLHAHQRLMRARLGLWLSAGLLVLAVGAMAFVDRLGLVLLVGASVGYFVSLGWLASAGNAIGRFGLKYLLAAVAGAGVLSMLAFPLAALVAPMAAFFWAKHEIGIAFRSLPDGAGGDASADSSNATSAARSAG
jgi:hypothetical protein